MGQKFAEGKDGGVPPWKEGEEIDLRVIHWTLWGPRRSGLYETVRELIQAEMKIEGVLPGMCVMPPPNASKREQKKYVEGGMTDAMFPHIRAQDWGYAMKFGDIHLIHYSFDKRLSRLTNKVFMAHGTLEAVVESAMREEDDQRALLSAADWINRFEGTITTSKRAHMFWKEFAPDQSKVHLVNKGIDLDWWKRTKSTRDLQGNPSVLYGEVWRGIKHPMHLLYAMNLLWKENPDIRLNTWGLTSKKEFWEYFMGAADFWKFIGTDNYLPGPTDYPEHFYSRGDVLVSPVLAGDVSRVAQESMACGCPVISWDTDPYGDNHAYKLAKGFDIEDLAEKIKMTAEEVYDDREGVARKCRAIAEKYFDMNEEAKSIVKILRKIVNES